MSFALFCATTMPPPAFCSDLMSSACACYKCLYPDSPPNGSQVQGMQTITRAWRDNKEFAYVGVPTGNGKTRMLCSAGMAAKQYGGKSIYVTPTTAQQAELFDELRDNFDAAAAVRYGNGRYVCTRKIIKARVQCPQDRKIMEDAVKLIVPSGARARELANALVATAKPGRFDVDAALQTAGVELTGTEITKLVTGLNQVKPVRTVTCNRFHPKCAKEVDEIIRSHIACEKTRADIRDALILTADADVTSEHAMCTVNVAAALARLNQEVQWETFTSAETLALSLAEVNARMMLDPMDRPTFDRIFMKCVEEASSEFAATQRETLCTLLQRHLHLSEIAATEIAALSCGCEKECKACPKDEATRRVEEAGHVVLNYDLLLTSLRSGKPICHRWREHPEGNCTDECHADVILADEAHEIPERLWNFCYDELGTLRHPRTDPTLSLAFQTVCAHCHFPEIPSISDRTDALVSEQRFDHLRAELKLLLETMPCITENDVRRVATYVIKNTPPDFKHADSKLFDLISKLPSLNDTTEIIEGPVLRGLRGMRAIERLRSKVTEVVCDNPRAYIWGKERRDGESGTGGPSAPTIDLFPDQTFVWNRMQRNLWGRFRRGVFCSGTLFDYPYGRREEDLSVFWSHAALKPTRETSTVETPTVQHFDRLRIVFGENDKGAQNVRNHERRGTLTEIYRNEARTIARYIGTGRGLVMSTARKRTRAQYEACRDAATGSSHIYYDDDPHRTLFHGSRGAYHGCRGLMTGTNDKNLDCVVILNAPWDRKDGMYHPCVQKYYTRYGNSVAAEYRLLWVRSMRLLLRQAIGRLMRGPDAKGGTVLLLDRRLRKERSMLCTVYEGATFANIEDLT